MLIFFTFTNESKALFDDEEEEEKSEIETTIDNDERRII